MALTIIATLQAQDTKQDALLEAAPRSTRSRAA